MKKANKKAKNKNEIQNLLSRDILEKSIHYMLSIQWQQATSIVL